MRGEEGGRAQAVEGWKVRRGRLGRLGRRSVFKHITQISGSGFFSHHVDSIDCLVYFAGFMIFFECTLRCPLQNVRFVLRAGRRVIFTGDSEGTGRYGPSKRSVVLLDKG